MPVSAQLNEAIVISKQFFDCFFIHAASLLNSNDCFAWRKTPWSSGEISAYMAANLRALFVIALNVKGEEGMLLSIWDGFEPLECSVCVFPLIYASCTGYGLIDIVQDSFTDVPFIVNNILK